MLPARWTMSLMSWRSARARKASRSVTSRDSTVTWPARNDGTSVRRCAVTTTSCPRSTSARAVWAPIMPSPPVTRIIGPPRSGGGSRRVPGWPPAGGGARAPGAPGRSCDRRPAGRAPGGGSPRRRARPRAPEVSTPPPIRPTSLSPATSRAAAIASSMPVVTSVCCLADLGHGPVAEDDERRRRVRATAAEVAGVLVGGAPRDRRPDSCRERRRRTGRWARSA